MITEKQKDIILYELENTTKSLAKIGEDVKSRYMVVSRIMNREIKKGNLDPKYRRLPCGLIQWQVDDVIERLGVALNEEGTINFSKIGADTGLNRCSIKRIYKNAIREGKLEVLTEQEIDNIFNQLPEEVRSGYSELEEDDQRRFKNVIRDYPDYILGKKEARTAPRRFKSKKLNELILKANLLVLVRKTAQEFIEYKKNKKGAGYTISPKHALAVFMIKGGGEKFMKRGKKTGVYYSSLKRIQQAAGGGKHEIWFPYFLNMLPPELARQVEEIESDKRPFIALAQEYVDLYNKKDKTGREYKSNPRYRLYTFFTLWNGEKFKHYKEGGGIYYKLLSRIKRAAGGTKRAIWFPYFLSMLPPEQARQVQEIESKQRLKREIGQFVDKYALVYAEAKGVKGEALEALVAA